MRKNQLYSIKNMTYTFIFSVFFLLIIVFVIMFINNMHNLLIDREYDNIMQQGKLESGILRYSLNNAQAVTRDWSSWDETYDFVNGDNPEYIEYTLTDYPFMLHNFNFLVIKDLNNNDLYTRFFDFQTEEELSVPEGFTDYLNRASIEMYNSFEQGREYSFQEKLGKDGLFIYNGECYFICTLPVLNSDETSEIAGSFTFGRILNGSEIRRMAITEENAFTIVEADSPEIDGLVFDNDYAIKTSSEKITLYQKYIDYFGNDTIIIKTENARDLYNDGVYYIFITAASLGTAIVILFSLLVYIINRLILKPLQNLSRDVALINPETLSLNQMHYGRSKEFFVFLSAINDMLGRLANNKNELEKNNARLDKMAHADYFTGLPNRFAFKRHLSEMIIDKLIENEKTAIIFLDIDRLKLINDTMGHNFGDRLIKEVACRLNETLPDLYLSRMGGDEFSLIIQGVKNKNDVSEQIDRIMNIFKKPFVMQNREFKISVSAGSSLFPDDTSDIEILMRYADMAVHKAKNLGGKAGIQFTPKLNEEVSQRIFFEQRIVYGLENDEFIPYFQPKVLASNRKIFGFEALVRWRSGSGMIMPGDFIPITEETGQIVKISWVVLRKSCEYNQILVDEGFDTTIAVNMTSQVLLDKDFFNVLESVLEETGMDPKRLDIEITEGTLIEDMDKTDIVLKRLSSIGVGISVDDFGTGYSALSYLKKLNVDRIKIDRSFVKDIPTEADSAAIIDAIIAMSKSLGLLTTSEGVETEEQFKYLRDKGCDEIQGYLIKPPVPFEEVRDLLLKNKSDIMVEV